MSKYLQHIITKSFSDSVGLSAQDGQPINVGSPLTPSNINAYGTANFFGSGNTSSGMSGMYVLPGSTAMSGSGNYFYTYFATPVTTGTTTGSAYTMYIQGAPPGATNPYALYVNAGSSYFGGQLTAVGNIRSLTKTIVGSVSGAITIAGQAAAGTYNFNLPTTPGTAGQFLTSGGGLDNPMTWSSPTLSFNVPGSSTPANAPLYVNPSVTTVSGANNYFYTYLNTPTITGTGTGAAITLYVAGAPSGGTIGNRYSLFVASGLSEFQGIRATTIDASGTIKSNSGNLSSTSALNPGIQIFNAGGFSYGMDLGYNVSVSTRFRTRIYSPNTADIAFSSAPVNASTQSEYTDHVIINGSTGNMSIGTSSIVNKLTVGTVSDVPAINPDAFNTVLVYEDQTDASRYSGTLAGNATYVQNNYVQLTPAINTQYGQYYWNINPGNAFIVTFDLFAGGGTGADQTGFFWYSTAVPSTTTNYNNGLTGGYNLIFQEFSGAENQGITLFSNFGTTTVLSGPFGNGGTVGTNTFNTVTMIYIRNTIRVIYNGTCVITYKDTVNRAPNTTNSFMGFTSHCGDINNFHRIRNIRISKVNEGLMQYVSPTSNNVIINATNVGIGLVNPSETLDIIGNQKISGTSFNYSNTVNTLLASAPKGSFTIRTSGGSTTRLVIFTNLNPAVQTSFPDGRLFGAWLISKNYNVCLRAIGESNVIISFRITGLLGSSGSGDFSATEYNAVPIAATATTNLWSVSGTSLTLTNVNSGLFSVGMVLAGTGITINTVITAITNIGGSGSVATLSISQTGAVSQTTTITGTEPTARCNSWSVTGTSLTLTNVTSGYFYRGMVINTVGIAAGTTIISITSTGGSGSVATLSASQTTATSQTTLLTGATSIISNNNFSGGDYTIICYPIQDIKTGDLLISNGSIGIGTNTPSGLLDINDNVARSIVNITGRISSVTTGLVNITNTNTSTGLSLNILSPNMTSGAANYISIGKSTTSTNCGLIDYIYNTTDTLRTIGLSLYGGPRTTVNSAGLLTSNSLLAISSANISTQGLFLQWNRVGGQGEGWIINQKGGGTGGIRFGESTNDNITTETMRIGPTGAVTVTNSETSGSNRTILTLNTAETTTGTGGAIDFSQEGTVVGRINSKYESAGAFGLYFGTYTGATLTERLIISASGNIGIGTTTPNAALQFSNSIVNRKIVLFETANNDHQFHGFGVAAATLRYQVESTGSSHVFYAATGVGSSNELMRISGAGNVSMTGDLSVINDTPTVTVGTGTGGGGSIYFGNNNHGVMRGDGLTGNDMIVYTTGGNIALRANGAGGGDEIICSSTSVTMNNNTTINGNLSLNGNISLTGVVNSNILACISITASQGVNFSSTLLVSNTITCRIIDCRSQGGVNMRFRTDGNSEIGSITNNGANASFNTSSDYRLKKNIIPITNPIEKILQLKPCNFDFKVNDYNTDGFIAHELQEILPYTVTGEKDGEKMQSVDYSKITPLLVAAIQELKKKIDNIKVELTNIK